jgi:hypothetical protein
MSDGNDTTIPKHIMLGKLLRMTTSPNDGEALTAIRKANALLTAAGWDWDKLLTGQIKIIEDPFKNLPSPFAPRQPATTTAYTPTPRAPAPPPPAPKRGTPSDPISHSVNRFADFCYCCGIEAVTGAGFIFKAKPTNTKFQVVCASCNTSAIVQPYAAQPQRNAKKKSVIDLA